MLDGTSKFVKKIISKSSSSDSVIVVTEIPTRIYGEAANVTAASRSTPKSYIASKTTPTLLVTTPGYTDFVYTSYLGRKKAVLIKQV